jgi:hypothetical protein
MLHEHPVGGCHHSATFSLPHPELIALGHRLPLYGSSRGELSCLESMESQQGAAIVLVCSMTGIVSGWKSRLRYGPSVAFVRSTRTSTPCDGRVTQIPPKIPCLRYYPTDY